MCRPWCVGRTTPHPLVSTTIGVSEHDDGVAGIEVAAGGERWDGGRIDRWGGVEVHGVGLEVLAGLDRDDGRIDRADRHRGGHPGDDRRRRQFVLREEHPDQRVGAVTITESFTGLTDTQGMGLST